MVMVSTKGRYALRIMVELARNYGTLTPLKEIAERQGISKKYLEIIVKDLVNAGLVIGHSGKNGGYELSRKPEDYNVGEIVETAEGTLASVACLADKEFDCPRKNECVTLPLWSELDEIVYNFFYSKKLTDLY